MVRGERHGETCAWRALLLFCVALAAVFLLQGQASSAQLPPVQGALFSWAEEHPGEPVPLIVQHDGTPDELLAFVQESGGTIEREFHIIPALDVEVSAEAVAGLARLGDVNWVSLDAPVLSTGSSSKNLAKQLSTAYPYAVKAPQTWSTATGAGVTVALVDTGVSDDALGDFRDASGEPRVQWLATDPELDASEDGFGHGTHVGGIITGYSTETEPAGKYVGIAPEARLLSIRIADDDGNATVGDLMAGLELVDDNREAYDIRVLNLSVSSTVAQSYTVDPIDAAVELLWLHGVVVVAAAGNEGAASDAVHYPPANDPFVITVGAFDDQGTRGLGDDALTSWSSRGTTQDGVAKPEVVAPGANIMAPVSAESHFATTHPEAIVDEGGQTYLRMSGTSTSAAAISGVAALMLEAHPEWTPGQVKFALLETAGSLRGEGQRVLADKAVAFKGTPDVADDGLTPSYILLAALGVDEADFDGLRWRDAEFDGLRWRGLELNGLRWREIDWSGLRWRGIDWSGLRWRGLDFDGLRWRGLRWRGFVEG